VTRPELEPEQGVWCLFLMRRRPKSTLLLMPGACLNPYGCEWSIGYLWRWMNWIGRVDVFVLALLLVYIVVVVARVSCRYRSARHTRGIDTDSRRRLAADLSIQLSNLKSIASTAPYLGLVGTCFGILSVFRGFDMEKHAAQVMMTSIIAAALVTTAAGILVAVPATCFYNYLRPRIDLLESTVSNEAVEPRSRSFQVARRLPLPKRSSTFPAFALIAAPSLAILVVAYTTFASFRPPKGFGIELASTHCEENGDHRLIVLHITDAGRLFLNTEQEDRNNLASRLSEIYGSRAHRILYLSADDAVPFQTVADAIDIVQNTSVKSSSLNIAVRLITPIALNASCSEPRFSQPASR
jgi:biopolymer transport protein ExbD